MNEFPCYPNSGEDNVLADLQTRWSTVPATMQRLVRIPELPASCSDGFEWPTQTAIATVQKDHSLARSDTLVHSKDLWTFPSCTIWVPEDATDLQLRLCIFARTSPAAHRGRNVTQRALRSKFTWSTPTDDVWTFVRACIHCPSSLGGVKIPRPFALAVHSIKPNDLLQFDYIDFGPSNSGDKYVMMLRDDRSDYK